MPFVKRGTTLSEEHSGVCSVRKSCKFLAMFRQLSLPKKMSDFNREPDVVKKYQSGMKPGFIQGDFERRARWGESHFGDGFRAASAIPRLRFRHEP
jgi:hypothetical protein